MKRIFIYFVDTILAFFGLEISLMKGVAYLTYTYKRKHSTCAGDSIRTYMRKVCRLPFNRQIHEFYSTFVTQMINDGYRWSEEKNWYKAKED